MGRTCELPGDAPIVQPVRGARRTHVGASSVSDGDYRTAVLLQKGQSSRSSITVTVLPSPYSKTCHAQSSDGLEVHDGVPLSSARYVRHVFRGVCTNRLRENIGTGWYSQP
jgi:hypothetical protein